MNKKAPKKSQSKAPKGKNKKTKQEVSDNKQTQSDAISLMFGDMWAYDPAPENPDHCQYESQYGHFINGEFVKGKDHFASINPSTEEVLVEVATADEKTVNKAVTAARKAYDNVWSKMPGKERGKYIYRIGRMI